MKNALTVMLLIVFLLCNSISGRCGDRDDDIRIAAIYALSGPAASIQLNSLLGIRCGVNTVNEAGGVLGKRLDLIEIDNRSTPIGSKQAAEKAVALDVTAIIGSAWSSHTFGAAPVAQKAGIPMISNISTHPGITTIGDYIFRACFSDRFSGQALAHFARNDLKADTALIVQDATSDYSMGLSDVFAESFINEGGRVLKRISYKTPLESFENLINRIVAIHADVLFLPGYDESGTIIKRCREKGMMAIPLGGDGWNFQEFYKRIGKMGTGSYFCAHYVQHSGALEALRFESKCSDMIKDAASLSDIALGYDTVRLLADAIRRAGNLDHKAIRDALAATKGFQGATGEITYPEGSRDPQKAVAIMKIQGDHATLVKWYKP